MKVRGLIYRGGGLASWVAMGSGMLFFATGAAAAVADSDVAKRVIILANSDDPDSLRIARHYAEARQVPRENIIAKKMSTGETISWTEFVATIWEPVRDELLAQKWIDAIPIASADSIGRKKYAINSHRISALVLCRGVPIRIVHEPRFYTDNAPFTQEQQFRSNAGVVDSELSLLAVNNYNINAYVPNPLFRNDTLAAAERRQIISVGRLDGPAVKDALALVDRALEVERTGLIGRGYVDIGGIYPAGDRWFESVAAQLEALGFDTSVDRAGSTMPVTARIDEPVFYFGWYASDLNGPFALPGFQFSPGAFALHIHSFSAGTLRSGQIGWTAPLVARGVTGTVGNVNEPYLHLTHRPDLFLRALIRGASLGEAASYSLPTFSWQTMLVGDPLYRPFAVSFEEQWKSREKLSARQIGYLGLRRMRLLETAGKRAEALAIGQAIQQATPSLALGFALAQRLQTAHDTEGAARALEYGATLKEFRTDEWALARETAQLALSIGKARASVDIYRALFANKLLPQELRLAWLEEATKAARTAQNPVQVEAWEKERGELGAAKK